MLRQRRETKTPAVVEKAVTPDAVTRLSVGPGALENYRRLCGDDLECGPLIKCLPGEMFLVCPSYHHERAAWRLSTIVTSVCAILQVPCEPARATLYPIPGTDRGYMPDDCFYLRDRTALAEGGGEPGSAPPDLVVEVLNTHPEAAALDACTRLGVDEVWVIHIRKDEFTIRHRLRSGPNAGDLVVRPASRALPTLTADEVTELFALPGDYATFERGVRRWVKRVLAPRVRARRRRGEG
jgi:Uma2 family endonuclease